MDSALLLFILVAAAAGLGAGWFLGTRQSALYRKERDDRVEDFRKAIADLADMQAKLDEARQACADARTECARLSSAHEAQERNFQERIAELKDARETLSAQFSEIGGKLLGEAQKNFLERADARFNQAGEKTREQLKALLQPVEATLKRYEEGLSQVEKERVGSYEALREAVTLLHAGHSQVRDETARLVNALRSSPKARGRWGEQSLKNVLEQAGLSPFIDFQSEVSVDTEDGRLRPDVIVRLPGGRKLIIDAKCSLNAFLDASQEVDETVRTQHLKAHAASIRVHAQKLGSKNYWDQFGDAADYVVMYIPGEHFLTAALEQDEGLWEWAFERRVLLATPTNLVAIARTVSSVWRQEKIAEEAAEIARLGRELHSRLATMGGHVARMGRNLELATGAYNAFVGSLESQVMTQARRFESLDVNPGGKPIEALPVIEHSTRPLTKLAGGSNDKEEGAPMAK